MRAGSVCWVTKLEPWWPGSGRLGIRVRWLIFSEGLTTRRRPRYQRSNAVSMRTEYSCFRYKSPLMTLAMNSGQGFSFNFLHRAFRCLRSYFMTVLLGHSLQPTLPADLTPLRQSGPYTEGGPRGQTALDGALKRKTVGDGQSSLCLPIVDLVGSTASKPIAPQVLPKALKAPDPMQLPVRKMFKEAVAHEPRNVVAHHAPLRIRPSSEASKGRVPARTCFLDCAPCLLDLRAAWLT